MNPSFPSDPKPKRYSFGAIDKVENKFRDTLGVENGWLQLYRSVYFVLLTRYRFRTKNTLFVYPNVKPYCRLFKG